MVSSCNDKLPDGVWHFLKSMSLIFFLSELWGLGYEYEYGTFYACCKCITIFLLIFLQCSTSNHLGLPCNLQIEIFKKTLLTFYTEDPSTSKDLSRIVNKYHFQRLSSLLDDPRTASTIVHGGERDEKSL